MKRLALALATLFSFAPAAQAATDYSAVYVFGDSLVDSGNATTLLTSLGQPSPTPGAAGFFAGRFSNGINLADYVSLRYTAQPARAYLQGGINFGAGGALAGPEPTAPVPRSFADQLTYFAGLPGLIPSDALVLVTFGGNDVRALRDGAPAVTFDNALLALGQGLTFLQSRGARNIVVTGVANVGLIPETLALGNPLLAAQTAATSLALNDAIKVVAQSVALPGTDLDFFDLYRFEQKLRADPSAYGLPADLDLLTSCQDAGAIVVDGGGCQGYLYFDDKHPTTQVHEAIANGIARQLAGVPEPQSWAMMIVGFGLVGAAARRSRARTSVAVRFGA